MHFRKSLFFLSLIGCLFLSSSAFADVDGNYTYTMSGGNATVTGYNGPGGAISIPATLGVYPTVAIGINAFYYKTGLTSVTIPGSVISIGDDAFQDCTGLTGVIIPRSVTSIGAQAFFYCTGLTSAYFKGDAPLMGTGVFDDCATTFTVYYTFGSTGFTSPFWLGYPTDVHGVCPATQALGPDNPKLENLRDFRDSKLAQSAVGRRVIQIYYNNADTINDALERSPALKAAARKVLEVIAPMVGGKD